MFTAIAFSFFMLIGYSSEGYAEGLEGTLRRVMEEQQAKTKKEILVHNRYLLDKLREVGPYPKMAVSPLSPYQLRLLTDSLGVAGIDPVEKFKNRKKTPENYGLWVELLGGYPGQIRDSEVARKSVRLILRNQGAAEALPFEHINHPEIITRLAVEQEYDLRAGISAALRERASCPFDSKKYEQDIFDIADKFQPEFERFVNTVAFGVAGYTAQSVSRSDEELTLVKAIYQRESRRFTLSIARTEIERAQSGCLNRLDIPSQRTSAPDPNEKHN